MRHLNSLILLSILVNGVCIAQPQSDKEEFSSTHDLVTSYMSDARLVGSATHEIAFWDIYDLTLYAEDQPFVGAPPYALEIAYKKGFTADWIADRSIAMIREQDYQDEMRLAEWHSQLMSIFPNVSKGTLLTGVYTAEMRTNFYCDGLYLGQIKDPEFGKYFFNIWLGEQSREPRLRRQLIGAETVISE